MKLRDTNVKRLAKEAFDVAIIGGGINGAVAASALASKGVKVALIDQGDFAGETSSNSSNLAWGGIKYLENHEYMLVNKLCKSRNHLMNSYPSTVREIRFLTTLQKGFRHSPFFVYLGTIVYWLFGRFFTQSPEYLNNTEIKSREPAIDVSNAQGGFEYSDAFLHDNDARFVFNFIRRALDNGAAVANYVKAQKAIKKGEHWQIPFNDEIDEQEGTINARVVINACGPHADIFNQHSEQKTEHRHLFSKGVHIIVDKVAKTEKVLAFFASDGRLFFVIPMGQKTCIGTTDEQVENPKTYVTEDDRRFILENANKLLDLDKPLSEKDIISERCGVRPLALKGSSGKADWVQLSRKHAIEVNQGGKYLSIFGGKLTDCINVGEEVCQAVESLGVVLPYAEKVWYGESSAEIKNEFLHRAKLMALDDMTPSYSSEPLTVRLWRRYDSHAMQILDEIQRDPSQAEQVLENAEYIRAELHYAARREMISKLEDFLRRRSKIEMVLRRKDITCARGIQEACEILFGDSASEKFDEYLKAHQIDHNLKSA